MREVGRLPLGGLLSGLGALVADSSAPGANGSRNLSRQAEKMQVLSASSPVPGLGAMCKTNKTVSKCVPGPCRSSCHHSVYTCFGKVVTLKPSLMQRSVCTQNKAGGLNRCEIGSVCNLVHYKAAESL